MKKVFAVLAIAGFMVACNNESETETTKTDSTAWRDSVRRADSAAAAQKMMNDTMNMKKDTVDKMNPEKK